MSRRRSTGQIRFQYRSNAGKMRVETLKRPAATTARSKAEKSRWTAAASSVGGSARASAVKPTCRPSRRARPSHQIRPSHETEPSRPSRPSHQATSSELCGNPGVLSESCAGSSVASARACVRWSGLEGLNLLATTCRPRTGQIKIE